MCSSPVVPLRWDETGTQGGASHFAEWSLPLREVHFPTSFKLENEVEVMPETLKCFESLNAR